VAAGRESVTVRSYGQSDGLLTRVFPFRWLRVILVASALDSRRYMSGDVSQGLKFGGELPKEYVETIVSEAAKQWWDRHKKEYLEQVETLLAKTRMEARDLAEKSSVDISGATKEFRERAEVLHMNMTMERVALGDAKSKLTDAIWASQLEIERRVARIEEEFIKKTKGWVIGIGGGALAAIVLGVSTLLFQVNGSLVTLSDRIASANDKLTASLKTMTEDAKRRTDEAVDKSEVARQQTDQAAKGAKRAKEDAETSAGALTRFVTITKEAIQTDKVVIDKERERIERTAGEAEALLKSLKERLQALPPATPNPAQK
jgi:hypothetical protein